MFPMPPHASPCMQQEASGAAGYATLSTDHGSQSSQQDTSVPLPPSCRPGADEYLTSSRFVPMSVDCNSLKPAAAGPTAAADPSIDTAGVNDADYAASVLAATYPTSETPVKVCSSAFETTAGALGAIYVDEALTEVLALATPAEGRMYRSEQMLEKWPSVADAGRLQAFHVQCDVTTADVVAMAAEGGSGNGADGAVGGGSAMLGDRCRVVHWESGLCVAEYGPGRLMVDECSRDLTAGARWRFCAVRD